MKTSQATTGFVYLIRDGNAYKIGKSVDPQFRMTQVASADAVLVHVIPSANPYQIEGAMHRAFALQRRDDLPGREWFTLSEDDVALICSLAAVHTVDDLPFSILPANSPADRHKERRNPLSLGLAAHRRLKKLAAHGNRPLQWELDRIVLEAFQAAGLEED